MACSFGIIFANFTVIVWLSGLRWAAFDGLILIRSLGVIVWELVVAGLVVAGFGLKVIGVCSAIEAVAAVCRTNALVFIEGFYSSRRIHTVGFKGSSAFCCSIRNTVIVFAINVVAWSIVLPKFYFAVETFYWLAGNVW